MIAGPGQADHQREPSTRRVVDGQLAAHGVDEAACHRQTEPNTGGTVTEPLEGLEDPLAVGGWYAGTMVDHSEVDAVSDGPASIGSVSPAASG